MYAYISLSRDSEHIMKKCKRCKIEKPFTEFYKHAGMADGFLNTCKTCKKKDAIEHRNNNLEKIRAYDRARGNRKSPDYLKKYREKYPNKYKAHRMVSNAIRDEKLFKESCEICGTNENIHAHHDDYLKPLNIRWLCAAHHHQWHAENGEAKNP